MVLKVSNKNRPQLFKMTSSALNFFFIQKFHQWKIILVDGNKAFHF